MDGKALPLTITEAAFSLQVEDMLKLFGWRWCHFRPAWSAKGYRTPIKGYKGFPDYVAVRNGVCLFIELKSEKGILSDDQKEWLDMLSKVPGLGVFIWRPSDFDEMAAILGGVK